MCSNSDQDDCIGHSCTNGATCVDEIAGYSCQCQAGYVGTWCETGEMMSVHRKILSDVFNCDDKVPLFLMKNKGFCKKYSIINQSI